MSTIASGRRSLATRRSLRMTLLSLVMLDTIRRILGNDVRPVDVWMLVIELAVLGFIIFDSVWDKVDRFRGWSAKRQRKRNIKAKLVLLNSPQTEALKCWAVKGLKPADSMLVTLGSLISPIVSRDALVGWVIREDYLDDVVEWAKKV